MKGTLGSLIRDSLKFEYRLDGRYMLCVECGVKNLHSDTPGEIRFIDNQQDNETFLDNLCADEGLTAISDLSIVQEVLQVLHEELGTSCTEDQLVTALKYYLFNDAFIDPEDLT